MKFAASKNGNPFPGLRSFEPEQAYLFFGRDEQIRDLTARLQRCRFLPIVGLSGSGKSSLVRAGLIPALTGSYVDIETSGWRIVMLRPGRKPMNELAAALCREFAIPKSEAVLRMLCGGTSGLARVARQYLGCKEKLLILVDQFEELFRYREEAEVAGETDVGAAFVKLLLAAAGESAHPQPEFDNLPVFVVTTMRSDFLGECSRFRGLPEALNKSQYLIPRLTREQQRDVIEGPISMAGASIEPALVQRVLNDLGDNPDQLPALQHALMCTWEQSATGRAQSEAITVANYEAVGGMADALDHDAERVYDLLSKGAAAITRRLFQRLVQPGSPNSETRSLAALSELVAVTAVDIDNLKPIISIFEERGFLTISGDQDPIIDITHESLIRGWRRLTEWVQEEARSATIYRRLVDQAALYANGEAILLVNPQLQLTQKWCEETKPNEAWASRYDSRFAQAMKFLEQSLINQSEQQRRSHLKMLGVGTLFLLAIGGSIYATIGPMKPTFRELFGFLTIGVVLWRLLRFIRGFRHRLEMRKAAAPTTVESTRERNRFFSAFISVLTIAFALLLLLVVSPQQTTQSRILSLLVSGVGALSLLGLLLLVFGVPAYNYILELKDHSQRLEEKLAATEVQIQAQNAFLEEDFPDHRKIKKREAQ